jgi:hypothetical protein
VFNTSPIIANITNSLHLNAANVFQKIQNGGPLKLKKIVKRPSTSAYRYMSIDNNFDPSLFLLGDIPLTLTCWRPIQLQGHSNGMTPTLSEV